MSVILSAIIIQDASSAVILKVLWIQHLEITMSLREITHEKFVKTRHMFPNNIYIVDIATWNRQA